MKSIHGIKKIVLILLLGSIFYSTGCGSIFCAMGGGITECQKTKEPGQARRKVDVSYFIIDLLFFFPGLAVDFATGGIYKPCTFHTDQIVKTDGTAIQCVVQGLDSTNVSYIMLSEPKYYRKEHAISKKEVSFIYYYDGRTDTLERAKQVHAKFAPVKRVDSILAKESIADQHAQIDIKIDPNDTIHSLSEALKAVVTIKVTDGHGSGCIISPDGYVITNYHVISQDTANEMTLFTDKGEQLKAIWVRSNIDYDLALLKISNPKKCTYLMAADSVHGTTIGETVYAIGTPLDLAFGQSLTKGIVSGNRKIDGKNSIQSDVSVNHGNSGGAMINKKGTLLGVVNSKIVGEGVQGLGFAIPAYYIESALNIKFVK